MILSSGPSVAINWIRLQFLDFSLATVYKVHKLSAIHFIQENNKGQSVRNVKESFTEWNWKWVTPEVIMKSVIIPDTGHKYNFLGGIHPFV